MLNEQLQAAQGRRARRCSATISELITATEIAERAIAGLKATVREGDQTLGERLRAAERFRPTSAQQIGAGEVLLATAQRASPAHADAPAD